MSDRAAHRAPGASRPSPNRGVTMRELGFFLRGRINSGLSRLRNRSAAVVAPTVSLEEVLAGPETPLALSRLLIGHSNAARESTVGRYLERRGLPVVRHRFSSFEGSGENFRIDVGSGEQVLVLIAHHDAVPGSPGANDNAAAVGILLSLLARLQPTPPRAVTVRFLFTACEELGYLGAREYVKETALAGIVGVVSLELCGIGDSLVFWDVELPAPTDSSAVSPAESEFLGRIGRAMERLGRRRDESYHFVGHIPVFGSDHRAFAAAGVPAYGLTIVPAREADALRRFVLSPSRSILHFLGRRPQPFDTYHTQRDAAETLEAPACDAVVAALESLIAELA